MCSLPASSLPLSQLPCPQACSLPRVLADVAPARTHACKCDAAATLATVGRLAILGSGRLQGGRLGRGRDDDDDLKQRCILCGSYSFSSSLYLFINKLVSKALVRADCNMQSKEKEKVESRVYIFGRVYTGNLAPHSSLPASPHASPPGSSDSKIHHQKYCRPHLVPLGGENSSFVQPHVVGVSASNHHVAIVTETGDVYVIFPLFYYKPQHPLQIHVGQRLCWSACFGSSWCSRWCASAEESWQGEMPYFSEGSSSRCVHPLIVLSPS